MTTLTKPGQELVGHSGNDEIGTPRWLYDDLNRRFQFDYDAAASADNFKCLPWSGADGTYHLDIGNQLVRIDGRDGLTFPWAGRRVFVNPPYSAPLMGQFIEKAIEERNAAEIVVMLVKYDASTANGRLLREHFHLEYLKRIRYEGMSQGATFPSVVAIVRPDPPTKPREESA